MEDLLGCSTRDPDPVRQPRRELPGLRTFPPCSIAQVEWGGNAAGADHFSRFSRTLALYGWPQTLACRHEIAGVVGIETRRASVWTHDGHGASLARGTEIRVTLDETGIAECSLHLLAQVLNRFFRVSRLVLVSHQSGNELLHCLPDNAVFA